MSPKGPFIAMTDFPNSEKDESPYICVDLSAVDSGEPEKLKNLIHRCAECNVEAVNLPLYRTNHLVSLVHREEEAEERRQQQLDRKLFSDLTDHAQGQGMDLSATVFDPELLDWYDEKSETSYVQFHGGDITYRRLLEATAETSLIPVVSTAAANADEIQRALDWIDHPSPVLLHEPIGTSLNIDRLSWLKNTFENQPIGLLHDLNDPDELVDAPLADLAVWLPRPTGSVEDCASILDALRNHLKEPKTDPDQPIPDSSDTTGKSCLPDNRTEAYRSRYRRSLMASESLAAGETLRLEKIREMRPAGGLPAENVRQCNGMMVTRPTDPQEMIAY